ATERGGLLGVQRLGVGATGELGVRDVEPGVDDRHGDARPGRGEPGDADLREPPFVRLQGIRRVGRRGDAVYALLLREDERMAGVERRYGGRGECRLEAPQPEPSVDLACACPRE